MMVNVDDENTLEPLYISIGEGISSSSDMEIWEAGKLDNGSLVQSKLMGQFILEEESSLQQVQAESTMTLI